MRSSDRSRMDKLLVVVVVFLGCALVSELASGQTGTARQPIGRTQYPTPRPSYQPPRPTQQPATGRPIAGQPIAGQNGGLQRPAAVTARPNPVATPAPRWPKGFPLTQPQQAQLDQVLLAWERSSDKVKTFKCRFTRFEYNSVFGSATKPLYKDDGEIKFGAPDRGLFHALRTDQNGKMVKIDPQREEHWMTDGKSIFNYDYKERLRTEIRLPPEMQGKAIANGPVPFLFGAKAAELKRRYLMRLIAPPPGSQGLICLEAYPRFQEDAANYRRVELLLTAKTMTPYAMQVFKPSGSERTAYRFDQIVVNSKMPIFLAGGDPFKATLPRGWKQEVRQPRAEVGQSGATPGTGHTARPAPMGPQPPTARVGIRPAVPRGGQTPSGGRSR